MERVKKYKIIAVILLILIVAFSAVLHAHIMTSENLVNLIRSEIDNTLEHIREHYLKEEGIDNPHAWSLYVITKSWLGLQIENKQEIIDYFNSKQQDDGAWERSPFKPRMFTTHRVLYSYFLLNSKPAKSLDLFFSNYDTWEEAQDYVKYEAKSDFRDIYHITFAWALYYFTLPPWLDDYFLNMERVLSWVATKDFHKRTHILYNYVLARRQFPHLDAIINATLDSQRENGVWFNHEYESVLFMTGIQLLLLDSIRKLYPDVRADEIEASISKPQEWIRNTYKTKTVNNLTYGYFADSVYGDESSLLSVNYGLFFGTMASILSSNIEGTIDSTFDALSTHIHA